MLEGVFDPGDVEALTESMRLILQAGPSKREEMGAASIKIVGERLSEEAVMPKIESVFESALTARQETAEYSHIGR